MADAGNFGQGPTCLAMHLDNTMALDNDGAGPLHWSGFHEQLDALLQQVRDPFVVRHQIASAHGSESSSAGEGSPRATAPLPVWLVGTDSGDAPATLVQCEQTPALNLSRSRAFTQGSSPPGIGLQSYSCRRQVPEWLVSPLRSSREQCSPFKALIAEIDAHLARDKARKASAARLIGSYACAEAVGTQTWCGDVEDAAAAAAGAFATDVEHRGHAQGNALLVPIAEDDTAASGCLAAAASASGPQLTSAADTAVAGRLPGSPLSSSSSGFEADTAPRQQLFRDLAGLVCDGDVNGLTLGSCAASPEQQRCGSYSWATDTAHEGAAPSKAASASPREDESSGSAPRVRILRRSVSPQQVVGAQHAEARGLSVAVPDGGGCEPLAIDACFGAASHEADKENTPSPGAANATAGSARSSAQRAVLAELHADSPLADPAEPQLPQLPDIQARLQSFLPR